MKRIPLLLVGMCLSLMATAQGPAGEPSGEKRKPVLINGLNYYLDEDPYKATVANGNQWTGELDIPSEVEYNGHTYPVTYISYTAFGGCETLTKVRIPKSVRDIYHYAGWEACKNPFDGCTSLESIEVEEGSQYMCSIDGVLYNYDKTTLYSYPAGSKRETYTIPTGVEKIGIASFRNCAALKSVIMPNTVTAAYGGNFEGCSNLEEVRLSDNLIHLEAYMFRYCTNLKTISIPPAVKDLGEYTFHGCSSLRTLDLPASVTFIGDFSFKNCKLEKLVIRGVIDEYLSRYTFSGLEEACTIYVPASEIERYKQCYEGTVLPLESYTTEIAMPNKAKNSSTLFDLQGRHLQEVPVQSIYIRDGRKYVGK